MSVREWLSVLLALLIPVSAMSGEQRPNVLFLAVDDMKDWVNCLGGYEGTVHTPNIDRLAGRGTLFTNAHCPSPKCAPSRAAILTGLMPSTTGLYENSHWWYANFPEITTIPVHFRAAGYRVEGAGKIFHHTAGNHPPNQWHVFRKITFRNDGWMRGVKQNYPWSKPVPPPEEFPYSGVEGLGHENDWGTLPDPEAEYDDTLSADFAVDFLSEDREKPFFLACGLFRPHLPWYVPAKYFDLYPVEDVVLPTGPEDDLDDIPKAGQALAASRRSDFLKIKAAGKYREAVRAYLASISYADAQLGRVLDALEKSAHSGNTIVVFWSDHGWHLGEKQHWHKTTLWEEATRVPFIISLPGSSGAKCSRPVGLIDIFPTLIELCDLPEIDSLDGRSLLPLLENPEAKWNHPAVIEYKKGNAAVRSERFRYIRYHDGSEELYDLKTDPNEWRNLADAPGFADTKKELQKSYPEEWSESALIKGKYTFDPETFTWTHKESGKMMSGK